MRTPYEENWGAIEVNTEPTGNVAQRAPRVRVACLTRKKKTGGRGTGEQFRAELQHHGKEKKKDETIDTKGKKDAGRSRAEKSEERPILTRDNNHAIGTHSATIQELPKKKFKILT